MRSHFIKQVFRQPGSKNIKKKKKGNLGVFGSTEGKEQTSERIDSCPALSVIPPCVWVKYMG